jgi:hypothetical protein
MPGTPYLVVSGPEYNDGFDLRIVVEVIGERLAAGHGGLLVPLGAIGFATVHVPITVSLSWFVGSVEPVAVLDPAKAREVTDALRALLGP